MRLDSNDAASRPPVLSGSTRTMSETRPEIIVVAREAAVAHPAFAKGGFIPLHPGATAYRNADFVRGEPAEMLAWCRDVGCEIVQVEDGPQTSRHRVLFPDEDVHAAFKSLFTREKGRP